MAHASEIATTHPAYYEAETGNEFLITDRILVTFREALPGRKSRRIRRTLWLVRERNL